MTDETALNSQIWPSRLRSGRPLANHRRYQTTLSAVALVVLAVALSWTHWSGPVRWTPDALFYEAQSRELAGTPAIKARREVFFGPLANQSSATSGRLEGTEWINYAAPFYRRRWVVPAMAAGLRPALGSRSLQIVSLLGYVLSGLLAYFLSRRRFSNGLSLSVAAFALWFPPLREWSGYPLTDSMGVAALTLALITGLWAMRGQWPRIAVWSLSVLLLSFTRDTAVVAVAAAVGLALTRRSRRAIALACSGALATLPALVFFGAPMRATMAFTFSDNGVPRTSSWGYIFHEYGTFARYMVQVDFPFRTHLLACFALTALVALLATSPKRNSIRHRIRQIALAGSATSLLILLVLIAPLQLPSIADPVPAGVCLIACLLPLFAPARGDDVVTLARYGGIAAVAYLFLLPQATELRLSLVVLPFAAIGFARGISWAWDAPRENGSSLAQSPLLTAATRRERETKADCIRELLARS